MIVIDKLKFFPFSTRELAIPNKPNFARYTIIFYPENTNFVNSYPFMNLRKLFVRKIHPIASRFPKTRILPSLLAQYKQMGLLPIRKIGTSTDNIFVDTTQFLDAVDVKFGDGTFRRVMVASTIKNFLTGIRSSMEGRLKIFFYFIDMDQEFQRDIYSRRIWPILDMAKQEEQFPFDYFLVGIMKDNVVTYTLFSNTDDTLPFARMRSVIANLQSAKAGFVEEDESSTAASKIVNDLKFEPNPPQIPEDQPPPVDSTIINTDDNLPLDHESRKREQERETLAIAIGQYLKAMPPSVRKKILTSKLDTDTKHSIAAKSILFSASGDIDKANELVDSVPADQKKFMFDKVKEELLSDIVTRSDPQNNSRHPIVGKIDINQVIENKEPSHILNKRKLDFEESFEKDLKNSLRLLGSKDFPLKLQSVKKTPIPVDPGDLDVSLYDKYEIVLVDGKKKKHPIEIQIPRILEDGTFLINGKKKYLIYQIILDPIYFIKAGQAKLETLYAPVSIHLKETKRKSYFDILIGGYKIPLMALMGYYLGFDDTMKLFKAKWKISDETDMSARTNIELSDGKFLNIYYTESCTEKLLNSYFEIPIQLSSTDITDKKSFTEALIKITGNRNCIFKIDEVLSNIMEPVAVQILKSKLLPFTLPQIILYICQELVKGRVDDRNNISQQRIRSSELFVHQIQKLVLGSYNEYRTRLVSGDSNAKYSLDVTQAVKEIVNSKLFRDLENINPIEELSCLTRVTPIGDGGIPDANALVSAARNIHPTYYGNLDPMDTPEGPNVGIINQLTVGAKVTSSRGSFIEQLDSADEKSGMLSVNSAVIPFVGSTDGCRVMFSGSQGRQSIPINGSEPPIIQTGYESVLTGMLSDSYVKKSIADGTIVKITDNSISIKLKNGRIQVINLAPIKLQSGQGISSLNEFKPIVKVGDTVKKNEIVAEGVHIKDGVISVGTNLLCAVMTWKGYSYEDGYIISDRVAREKLSSSALHEIEVLIKNVDRVSFIAQEGVETKRGEPLLIRTSKDVEEIVGLDLDELEQGQIITKSPGGKIVSLEIFPNVKISRYPVLEEPFQKFRIKYEESIGPFPKKFISRIDGDRQQFSGVLVKFKLIEHQQCEDGDKITNSYGGKGVIAKIEPEENMPVTPWGERIDVILNPIAIINRMNPSTIKELHLSLTSKFLAKKLVAMGTTKSKPAMDLLNSVLTTLDKTKDQKISSDSMKSFRAMSATDYANFIQKLVDSDYIFPFIIPPFQEPSLDDIKRAMSLVGAKPAYKLAIKEYGIKTRHDIAVGYLYYKKLEQQSGIKMSARSTGMVSSVTMQAIGGKGGGQKIGEMDSWSIINHGATNVLREFFGPLSDDHVTKDQIVSEITQSGSAEYREPKSSPTRQIFDTILKGMMLEPDLGNLEK